jgi:hypothetical protein
MVAAAEILILCLESGKSKIHDLIVLPVKGILENRVNPFQDS